MNSSQIFELALGLSKSWFVKDLKMIVGEGNSHGQMDIYLDFERGFKFADSEGNTLETHDTVERTWQHLNFFQPHRRSEHLLFTCTCTKGKDSGREGHQC